MAFHERMVSRDTKALPIRASPGHPINAAAMRSGLTPSKALILFGCALLQMGAPDLAFAQDVTAQPEERFRIEQGRAGAFVVGMTTEDLYRIVGRGPLILRDQFVEGSFLPVVQLDLVGASEGPSLLGHLGRLQCENMWAWYFPRWVVRDDRFRTDDGMGVGSTFAALREEGWVDEQGFPGARAMHSELDRFPWIYFRFFVGECPGCFPPEDDAETVQIMLQEPFPLLRQRRCAELSR